MVGVIRGTEWVGPGALLNLVPPGLIGAASRGRSALDRRRARRPASAAVGQAMQDVAVKRSGAEQPLVVSHRILAASADRAVLRVDRLGQSPAILKTGWSPSSCVSIEAEAAVLVALHQNEALGCWRDLVPVLDQVGGSGGQRWLVQSALGDSLGLATGLGPKLEVAAAALSPLHEATAEHVVLDTTDMRRIVAEPLGSIASACPSWADVLANIAKALQTELLGKAVTLAHSHGDFAPVNLVLRPTNGDIVGIVDWELAKSAMPPGIDLAHFVVAHEANRRQVEHGEVFAKAIVSRDSTLSEQLSRVGTLARHQIDHRTLFTLAWIHHVAANLTKSDGYHAKSVWRAANVDVVLRAVSDASAGGEMVSLP